MEKSTISAMQRQGKDLNELEQDTYKNIKNLTSRLYEANVDTNSFRYKDVISLMWDLKRCQETLVNITQLKYEKNRK